MPSIKKKALKFMMIATIVLLVQLIFTASSFAEHKMNETTKGMTHSPFTQSDVVTTDLDTLGGDNCEVIASNKNGQAVGCLYLADGTWHAFMWDNGKMIDLGTLGGSSSCAFALNNMGQVVGYSEITGDLETHAFIWDSGKMTDLGALGGDYSCAQSINDKGQVLGGFNPPGSLMYEHAFVWRNGKMTDLGTLGGDYSFAQSIDENGRIYGISSICKDSIAPDNSVIPSPVHNFMWDNGIMIDLDDKVPAITITPYETNPTTKNITVTASVYDGTLNETSHTFTENGSFTFTGTDTNGNTSRVTVTISNLYKTPPVITINPHKTDLTNKNITVTAFTSEGTLNETSHTFTQNGSFTFIATNVAGTSNQMVTITNIDKTPPIITLNGNSNEYITCGAIYVDKGARAIDNMDGDITPLINMSGNVNTSSLGTYSVTYSVYDQAGNAAVPITRTVIVIPNNLIPSLPCEIKADATILTDISVESGATSSVYLNSIMNGTGTLIPNTDYSVTGNIVTIKKGYLTYYFGKFPTQNLYLRFNFNDGTTKILTIYTGSTPHPEFEVTVGSFNLKEQSDLIFPLKLNGNFIPSIENMGEKLLQKVDYTYSKDTHELIIRKGYLAAQFAKSLNLLSLTVEFTGDKPQTLSIKSVESL